MELRQLKMFVKAAQTLNFSEAARLACVTQSTLSLNIKQLEEELGLPLFDRNNHGVFLTEAGQELLEFAKKAITAANECKERMADLSKSKTGTLNIGMTNTFIPLVTQVLSEFTRLYPGIYVKLKQKTAGELKSMLEKHEIDIALSYGYADNPSEIESTPLYNDHLAAIVRTTHPLAKYDKVKLGELTKYSFALPAQNIISRRRLDKILANKNLTLDVRMEMSMAMPLFHIVRTSNLITVLSTTSLKPAPYTDLKAIMIDEDDCVLQGSFHTIKGSYHKHSVKEFLRLMLENINFYKLDR